MKRYFVLGLNPEPWAIGDVYAGRRGGKLVGKVGPNANLVAYQNAVREELEDIDMLPEGKYKLTFYFWRQQAQYLDTNDRKQQRNQADATNMQKGLEDALQGVLFENDRDVEDIRSVIMNQGPSVKPCILIEVEVLGRETDLPNLPDNVWQEIRRAQTPPELKPKKNVWPPPGKKW